MCIFKGCKNKIKAKKLCNSHYAQQRRGKELTPIRPKQTRPTDTFCTGCKKTKSKEDFYYRSDGKPQWHCKECMKQNAQRRRDEIKESIQRLEDLKSQVSNEKTQNSPRHTPTRP